MAKLPEQENTTLRLINAVDADVVEQPRGHLGASQIGASCDRALWYGFRWASDSRIEPRIRRLFRRGEREEAELVSLLRQAGVTVHEVDPDTGEQFKVSAINGHFGGSLDGAAIGLAEAPETWHVLEFKTHNDKSFRDLQKQGVELSKFQHFVQMQMYMHLTGMDRAYYLAVNKNDDQLYAERVRYDKACAERHLARAERIIEAKAPPDGISNDPAYYECKFCDHSAVCFGERTARVHCRTCVYATPIEDGQWFCELSRKDLSLADQLAGCESHLFIPPVLAWAETVDATDDGVNYRSKLNGYEFTNGAGHYASREIYALPPRSVGDAGLDEIKREFDGEVKQSWPK